jgi:hypothetical protein
MMGFLASPRPRRGVNFFLTMRSHEGKVALGLQTFQEGSIKRRNHAGGENGRGSVCSLLSDPHKCNGDYEYMFLIILGKGKLSARGLCSIVLVRTRSIGP